MKLRLLSTICSASLILCALSTLSAQEATPVDISKNLVADFPKKAEAQIEVINDELQNKPVLKIEVPEVDVEAWQGKVTYKLEALEPGTYTVTFAIKTEPSPWHTEIRTFDFSTNPPVEVGPRKNINLTTDWQEYEYQFEVEGQPRTVSVTWTALARSGKTIYLTDVRLTKN